MNKLNIELCKTTLPQENEKTNIFVRCVDPVLKLKTHESHCNPSLSIISLPENPEKAGILHVRHISLHFISHRPINWELKRNPNLAPLWTFFWMYFTCKLNVILALPLIQLNSWIPVWFDAYLLTASPLSLHLAWDDSLSSSYPRICSICCCCCCCCLSPMHLLSLSCLFTPFRPSSPLFFRSRVNWSRRPTLFIFMLYVCAIWLPAIAVQLSSVIASRRAPVH